ncbi:response regulator [Pseudaminobacter arsenicus]|uniref:histidine kinase n=1 Tax=Borborobacter arsenicus TaxID=1851146 RepID=A0A432V0W1_9HYPH|nr:ATP-binding protein [Pseudaminobacter arsenicus]RUM95823.1 response regulator [Pseudaminobacter arsenicus]
MMSVWQSLLANLALVSILLVAWDLLSDATGRLSKRMQSLLLGLVMGIGAVTSMAIARPIVSGFILDLRSAFIAAAAFFGGVPAMVVATTGAIVYRLYIGGEGAVPGSAGILVAAIVGLVCHGIVRARQRTMLDIFGFGVAVALGTIGSLLAFPSLARAGFLQQAALPLTLFGFLSSIVVGVLLDRQLRRRELSEANMIYSAMVLELPDCLNVKDLEGRFIAANPATAALMRAGSVENLIGKTDFDFYPRDVAERFREDELAMIRSGETLRIDQPTLLADGRQGWLSSLKAPFRDESNQIVGVITHNRDVTEQKRNAQLKNEFISTVSHELRTPLTSIRGSLGLIAAGVAGDLPPKAANLVKIAHANSERLVHLINDILDMESIESGKMTFEIARMPIRPVLEQAIAGSANYMTERQVRIVLVDDAPRAESAIDPDRLHQVLANLLSNAIKYSPAGETVTLKVQRQAGGMLRISVVDRGSGIPEAFRNRIFGKFEQADASNTREKGGTGLGLSIAKSIVERLGGTISFESKEGTGTSFHMDLPEALRKEPPQQVGIEEQEVTADRRMRVLIVEDEPDVSTVIAALLDAEGFSSDVAPDVTSAKALLQSRDYEALTLDIKLAGESGIKLFRDIRDSPANRDISIIVISAVADEARRVLNGSAVGIIDWLEKPVDPERLHTALGKIVARKVDRKPRILHVEDDEGILAVMSEGLGSDVAITYARTLKEAKQEISSQHFDLLILDITLPDGSGLDLLSELPLETGVIVFSAAEFDQTLSDRVMSVMTKTKVSELDVARLVASFLPRVCNRAHTSHSD